MDGCSAFLWTPVTVAVFSAGFLKLLGTGPVGPRAGSSWFPLWGGSLATAVIWHVALFPELLSNRDDSFYTLSAAQRGGLLAVCVVLIASLCTVVNVKATWILHRVDDGKLDKFTAFAVDLVLCLILFALAYGISPQLYYTYYLSIIPDLPPQWVIPADLNLSRTLGFLIMHSIRSLSDALSALTLWTLLLYTAWRHVLHGYGKSGRLRPIALGSASGIVCAVWIAMSCGIPM